MCNCKGDCHTDKCGCQNREKPKYCGSGCKCPKDCTNREPTPVTPPPLAASIPVVNNNFYYGSPTPAVAYPPISEDPVNMLTHAVSNVSILTPPSQLQQSASMMEHIEHVGPRYSFRTCFICENVFLPAFYNTLPSLGFHRNHEIFEYWVDGYIKGQLNISVQNLHNGSKKISLTFGSNYRDDFRNVVGYFLDIN